MYRVILSDKKKRRTAILLVLILLDIISYGLFDTLTAAQADNTKMQEITGGGLISKIGWFFSLDNILSIQKYSIGDVLNSLQSVYTDNSLILNKVFIFAISGIILILILKFAPELLAICYGYLSGIAIVGFYNGLLNLGFNGILINTMPPGFDAKIIPEAIMTICVVTGGAIAFSRVVSYLIAEVVALKLFDRDMGLNTSLTIAGQSLVPVKETVRIKKEDLPEYEEKIRVLSKIERGNDLRDIGAMYEKVNELATHYNVDQYYILYDVYKVKNGKPIYEEPLEK